MPAFPELPPIARQPLSVVLLARHAAAHVELVVKDWLHHLDQRGQEFELLLIDDGSQDETVSRALAIAHARLRVIGLTPGQGEGAALRRGLAEAKNPLVFYTLCQPEYRPQDMERLLDQPLHGEQSGWQIDHVHLLSGYRAAVAVPLFARCLGWLWRILCVVVFSYSPHRLPGWLGWRRHLCWLLTRIVFGLRHQDVSCPFRLFRHEILRRIPLQSRGPFAHVELLAKANFLGHLMGEEMPINVDPGPYRGDAKQMWREAIQLFNRPDFGPAVLPAEPCQNLAAPVATVPVGPGEPGA